MALSTPPSERKRVKVYELRENDWFDRGTGFCNTTCIVDKGRIFVESEEDPERILLESRIKKEDSYQKQQDTLIVWTDNNGVDMALSFQEAEGCGMVCDAIGNVQQRPLDEPEEIPPHPLSLPPPSLAALPQIEDIMRRAANQTQMGRDSMSKMIASEEYILKLTPLVTDAEDLESLPDLHRLCSIMKTLILFNDTQIIEQVVRDNTIQGVVGALEYDPDFPNHKANHRQYLQEYAKFKEVIPLEDEDIRRKIHFTYRLQYLKDVVLARILDDPTFGVLNSLIFFHQVDIVQHIQTNVPYLTKIFGLVNDSKAPAQKRKDAVLLIQQSCAIAKNLQAPARASLYENLINEGLFPTITFALQHQDAAVRVAGTDILVALIDHSAVMTRQHAIKAISERSKPMTETLIELLLVETDLGVKAQIADALKVLLDPSANGPGDERPMRPEHTFMKLRSSPSSHVQNENFLQHFYEHSANKLFQPLKDLEKRTDFSNLTTQETMTFVHLVEILCFFMRQHNARGRLYILDECFHKRVAQLLENSTEKHLKLSAIKYFRTVVTIGDEHHLRQMYRFDIFRSVLGIITATMPRDNLLNSACLELFEYVRRENVRFVIQILAEDYRDILESITFTDIFRGILLRYEQRMNPPPEGINGDGTADSSFMTTEMDTANGRHITINGGGRWNSLRESDPEEDAYFNTSDEEEEEDELAADHPMPTTPEASPRSGASRFVNGLGASPIAKPLVDYEDDDSDETLGAGVVPDDAESDATSSPLPNLGTLSSDAPKPPSSSTSPASANRMGSPPSATGLPRPPSAKRMREEDDDDDELSKLSMGIKRRSSATNLKAVKDVRDGNKNASPGVDNETAAATSETNKEENADQLDNMDTDENTAPQKPLPPLRQSARQKEKDTPNIREANRTKRITISLGGKAKES